MSENDSITKRAEQILAMLTPEQKAKVERKGAAESMSLAIALAKKEKASGQRTAKAALSKALIAVEKQA